MAGHAFGRFEKSDGSDQDFRSQCDDLTSELLVFPEAGSKTPRLTVARAGAALRRGGTTEIKPRAYAPVQIRSREGCELNHRDDLREDVEWNIVEQVANS